MMTWIRSLWTLLRLKTGMVMDSVTMRWDDFPTPVSCTVEILGETGGAVRIWIVMANPTSMMPSSLKLLSGQMQMAMVLETTGLQTGSTILVLLIGQVNGLKEPIFPTLLLSILTMMVTRMLPLKM